MRNGFVFSKSGIFYVLTAFSSDIIPVKSNFEYKNFESFILF